MRTFTRSIFFLASVSGGVFGFTGCAADCEEKGTCGPYAPTGGSTGEAGTPATGGSSGTSGTGGSSATGGTSGAQAGEGGSDAGGSSGNAGTSASGGTSGAAGSAGDAGGSGGAAGMTGGEGGEAGGAEPVCNPSLTPFEDACVVHEDFGVFVSPTGNDDEGDGSRENPFATVGKGITEAITSNKRVYSCADGGTYGESVTLDVAASGLEMFGGFACGDWTYDTALRSRVTSSTPLALRVEDAVDVRIEDFGFTAADGVLPGESSIGAIVANSTDVVLRRVVIEAGDGVEGADGVLVEFDPPEQSTLDGNDETPDAPGTGGGEKVCVCQGALTSIGGGGGPPSATGQSGAMGAPDYGGGTPGVPDTCGSEGTGDDGAPAPAADAGAGAATLGSPTTAGWMPGAGQSGAVGQPGQGGGGGASRTNAGHGGGGGCGGCGGNGGGAGQGGGASIALLVVDSTLIIDASSLVAANAGNGGNGAVGQVGQQEVGEGGNAVSGLNSCDGGNGGFGGTGGAGGGGAGGISVGLVWSDDSEPTRSEVSLTFGSAGDAGIGGDPGENDGIAGVAQEVLEVP